MDRLRKLFITPTLVYLAETVGFEPSCPFGQLDFESLEGSVLPWILCSPVSISERRNSLILLGLRRFFVPIQMVADLPLQSRFSGKL